MVTEFEDCPQDLILSSQEKLLLRMVLKAFKKLSKSLDIYLQKDLASY